MCIRHYLVKNCKSWLFSILCWIARTRDCRTWWKQVIHAKSHHLKTFSWVTVSLSLKNWNMACHVIKININQKTNYLRLPVQLCPSPINPGLHIHTYDPYVLLHVASSWHLPMDASHLSVVELERSRGKIHE